MDLTSMKMSSVFACNLPIIRCNWKCFTRKGISD